MMSEKETMTILLDELQKTIHTRGMEGTIALLVNGRTDISPDKDIQFVLLTVLNQFGITITQLLNEKNDTTKYAKGFIIFYLRSDFKIKWITIGVLLDLKNQSWLWELMNMIKNLKPKLATDLPYCQAKEIIDKKVKEYLSTHKNPA